MGSSQSLQSPVEKISHWHSMPRERLIFDYGRAEISQYLQAVAKIQRSRSVNELNDIISMAVTRLKHEFKTVLTRQTESVMGSISMTELSSITDSTSYQFRYEDFVVYEAPSAEVVSYLRSIAETMNSCGHLDACIEVYNSIRRSFVVTIIKRLRLDELTAGDTKRFLLEELKMKIERWTQAAKVCTKILFKREKQFATQIFSGIGSASTHDECFIHTAKDAAVNLFRFAESVSLIHQSSERLEIVLILYEVMLPLTQDVNALFQLESAKAIRNSTAATLYRLEEEVRRMLSDFENAVLHELSTISNDGGRVHGLTKNVMGYVNLIVNYRKILTRLIVLRPSMSIGGLKVPDGVLQDPNSLSPLGLHLVLIISVLLFNLEKKSKSYKDDSLGYLFMMNNVKYIVQKIEGSRELQELIGADYLIKLSENVKGTMTSYDVLTCDRLLNCLRDDGLYVTRCCSSRVSKSALRKRIKTFNGVFEEIRSFQSSWEVQDLSLREQLRHSMLEKLMPAYECFLTKFGSHLKSGKDKQKSLQYVQTIHVKYSLQDLEALVMKNLFARYQQSPLQEAPVENFHLGGG